MEVCASWVAESSTTLAEIVKECKVLPTGGLDDLLDENQDEHLDEILYRHLDKHLNEYSFQIHMNIRRHIFRMFQY